MADRPMTDDDIEGSKGGSRSVALFSIVAVAVGVFLFIFAADVFHLAGTRPAPNTPQSNTEAPATSGSAQP